MLESEDCFCRSGNVISKEAAGEAIVLKLQTMEYYSLNEVATTVWNEVACPCGIQDVVRTVAAEFGIPAETAMGDLKPFLDGLLREGLIESRVDAPQQGTSPAQTTGPAPAKLPVVGRRYLAPAFEGGLLRRAAHTSLGCHTDGGTFASHSPQYKIS
jgi:hypothetical protein